MPVPSAIHAALSIRRSVELRLLLFSLLIAATGLTLTFFGKMSTVYPLDQGSININSASRETLARGLDINDSQAQALVDYRNIQAGHQFASVYRFRRTPLLKDTIDTLDWQKLYARSPVDVGKSCFSFLIIFILVTLATHFIYRRLAPTSDPFVFPVVVLLSGIGLMVALSVHDPLRDTFAFTNQAEGVVFFGPISLLLPFVCQLRRVPFHRYTYAYAVLAVFFLITLFTFGRGPAATHIQLFGFEPIEIIKVLLVFFIAAYLADRRMLVSDGEARKKYLPNRRDMLPLAAIYLFALSLFGAVKDLGPAVLLFGSFVAMLYLVTGQTIYPIIGVVLLLIAGYVGDNLGIGFFATRVEMWLHPWDNSNRLGGQLAQGLWGISTGGIFGSGLGLGGSSFVPRAGSDMAFTTIGEELGLVGGICVLVLYVVIVFRGFQIAKSALDDFDRLLASGITILIGLQALVITGGATGLIPLTGITLPFVSYGTSSLAVNFFCIGMLLSLSAKAPRATVDVVVPALFIRTSRRVTIALITGLLLFVGIGRLVWLQGVVDIQTATRTLRIPDADQTYRFHRNPRLLEYALNIPRGAIFDRTGAVLAENAKQGAGVSFLTEGVPRLYPFGAATSDIVYAVEQPASEFNPLGSDQRLRGYGSMQDLLPLYRRKDLPFPPSPAGRNVTLTIDVGLQQAAQTALNSAASRFGNGRGAAVVLDAKSGELLAAVTTPSFDPNTLTVSSWQALHSDTDSAKPLLNRAFAGTYTPGSVFKLVTATAAFQQNKEDLVFECDHTLPEVSWTFDGHSFSRRKISDDEEFAPHGTTDLSKAIRESCNVYFAQLGVALGASPIEHVIHEYGLNECPNLFLLGSDLPDCAYGQGTIQVTPYQMAGICQTIANSGVSASPTFFIGESSMGRRILSPDAAAQLTDMMTSVVTSGTASGVFDGLSVAGKTGSAELSKGQPHSWFVGFAPVIQPKVAFACIVEHGGHGRTAAALVCRSIVKSALRP